jgi:outer membrane receptor for ferrienterochelin and colicins
MFLFVCFGIVASQETGRLEGTVSDAATNEPLPGANITLVGTVLGAATDGNGKFIIEHLPVGEYDIQATMIGYKKEVLQKINIETAGSRTLSIKLVETVIETPELIVTANKRRQSIQDSPNSIGVMTSRDIEQKNQIYLDDFLEQASGVNFVGQQVNIRGSSGFSYGAGSRVLFLVDGVPVMPGDSGDIKWDLIPATQIERVEIIKGAGSALYGSSALGGVINVITKKASSTPVTHIRLSAGAYDRPVHQEWRWTDELQHFSDMDVDHTQKIGKKAEILLAAGRHQNLGYRQNTKALRHNASLKWNYQINGNHNLTISTNFEGGERESSLLWRNQRQALEVSPEAIGDYVESQKYGANLFHKWVASKNFGVQTRVSYFYNYWKNWYHDNITASTAQKPGMEVQGDWQLSDSNSFIFGVEGTWDHVVSGLVGPHDQTVFGFYAQNERALLSNLNLTIGLRYDNAWVDSGISDSELNPKVGFVWKAGDTFRVRASSGRGFRAPSMSERFSDSVYSGLRIIPNPDLKSETAWSHEVGANWNPTPFLYLDVSGFMNDYWDLIEPEPDANQVVQFINVTRARITGVETNLKAMPFPGLGFDIGYTFMNPQDIELDTTLAYRPRHLLTAGISFNYQQFEIGADFRYISRFEVIKVYPNDDRLDQKVLNLRTGYRIGAYALMLSVNNVFNYNYTQMERTIMPLRHFILTLSAKI